MIFVFLTLKHNEAYLEAGISLDEQGGENSDEFEPWALPEHQDLGPNCSGKICTIFAPYFIFGCLFFWLLTFRRFIIVRTRDFLNFARLQKWVA